MGDVIAEARELIQSYVDDINWDDPFWMDDIQAQYPTLSARELDHIYSGILRNKLSSKSADELEHIYQEQMDASPDSRNYVMVDVLEGLLASLEPGSDTD